MHAYFFSPLVGCSITPVKSRHRVPACWQHTTPSLLDAVMPVGRKKRWPHCYPTSSTFRLRPSPSSSPAFLISRDSPYASQGPSRHKCCTRWDSNLGPSSRRPVTLTIQPSLVLTHLPKNKTEHLHGSSGQVKVKSPLSIFNVLRCGDACML